MTVEDTTKEDPALSPGTNHVDDNEHETFLLGRPVDDSPEVESCKHCKKNVLKSGARAHIAQCLRVKKEKAQRKKEAREARERAEEEVAAKAAHRRRTAYLAGGIALIALVVVVALVLISQSGSEGGSGGPDPNETFAGVEQSNITLGSANAPVTVVEYADLQCPFCRDFAVDDLPGVVDDYVEPGDVKMELRLLGFIGPDSETGRQVAAGAAQQDLLWSFAESVYAHQETENSGYMNEDFLRERAEAVDGLDADEALAAIGSPEAQRYASEADSSASATGVDSTPTFLVRPTKGGGEPQLVSADSLRETIDKALAEAG
jgi:protein-disulfide isomerase